MRLALRPSEELLAWAAPRIAEMHGQPFAESAKAIGVERNDGTLVGVVAFHSWEPWNGTIEVSAVSEDARWLLARDAWRWMFDYAFRACDCQKIWSRTPRRNVRALRFLRALGFTQEAVLPRQFGSDDAVISHRFREEYYSDATPNLARLDFGNGLERNAILFCESAPCDATA
jgi:RimJ/RimL family protein N-acetyltransferase